MNDQSLTDTTPDPAPAQLSRLADAAVETLLTFEEILESARLVERIARVCVRGDLVEAHDEALRELAGLVDEQGQVVSSGDQALADQSRAEELNDRLGRIRAEMGQAVLQVKFRAMPDDEWEAFEKANRGANGDPKNLREYVNKLIARCAFDVQGKPRTLSEADVEGLRKKLTKAQMLELQNKAFEANTAGGLDVPKLPSFLLAVRPLESATS